MGTCCTHAHYSAPAADSNYHLYHYHACPKTQYIIIQSRLQFSYSWVSSVVLSCTCHVAHHAHTNTGDLIVSLALLSVEVIHLNHLLALNMTGAGYHTI